MSFGKDTRYADAVAAVKAMEGGLLTRTDMEQLIAVSGKAELNSLLQSKKGSTDAMSLQGVWDFIQSYAPECGELKVLLYRNDFHNLKAALKALIAGKEPERYYVRPTNLELGKLSSHISRKESEELPELIRDTASEAYELLTRTLDGQLSDCFIDSACIRALLRDSEKCGEMMQRYAQLTAACADIKTAYRSAVSGRQASFLELAIAGSPELDKDELIRAALSGTEGLMEYLSFTPYEEGARLLSESPAKYEKWCDDIIMELASEARLGSFGAEPLAAYYIAAETELKNLRILSVCKEFGADRETITERMRRLYG